MSGSGDTVDRRVVLDESEESCAVGTGAVDSDSGRVVVDELLVEDLHEVKQIATIHENKKRIDTTKTYVSEIL